MLTIPLSLLTAVICLNLLGQTINIMTLGGLALAIGILVDESTVTIENIHSHLEMGKTKTRAIVDACLQIAFPKLLILLCILAVFVPSFFMSGVPASMFLPLSLSVGLAMTASFLLSQTFVPVAANWILQEKVNHNTAGGFAGFRENYTKRLTKLSARATLLNPVYLIVSLGLLAGIFLISGTDIFPKVDTGQLQVRLRLPTGMRVERTEDATKKILKIADSISGNKIEISSAFVGTQPPSFPVNYIHLWTGGPNESVIKINLKKGSDIAIEDFKELLRKAIRSSIPNANISFEPGDLADQVLNLGSNNPIEILVTGRNLAQSGTVAQQLNKKLNTITYLRDVQIASPLDYPNIKLEIDRVKAGQLGLTVEQISRSTVAATSSSRFTQPNYWLDKTTGTAYQVQVEYPQYKMNSPEQIELIPVAGNTANPVFLRDVASWKKTTSPGEYDRINQQRFITITANIHDKDLGNAVKDVNKAIASLGELPKGIKITVRGQAELLAQTMSELQSGLWVAVVMIFLLLAISFQSFRLSLITMSIIPAVVAGSLLFLLIAGQTLNIQSYMGIIMAVGVAVANAILYITNAEAHRKQKETNAFLISARNRIRPILMTGAAMIAGMIPMAIGIGEAGDQTAPLGIAVIGGLLFSMISTLIFLPMLYQSATGKKVYHNSSLDPNDINSKYYDIHV
jgi:multidrug efflux pump subunit AcrB